MSKTSIDYYYCIIKQNKIGGLLDYINNTKDFHKKETVMKMLLQYYSLSTTLPFKTKFNHITINIFLIVL